MDRPPTNKWRVYVGRVAPDLHRNFRSKDKAYEYVRAKLPSGHKITVKVWENGRWRLFEVLNEQPPSDTEQGQRPD